MTGTNADFQEYLKSRYYDLGQMASTSMKYSSRAESVIQKIRLHKSMVIYHLTKTYDIERIKMKNLKETSTFKKLYG